MGDDKGKREQEPPLGLAGDVDLSDRDEAHHRIAGDVHEGEPAPPRADEGTPAEDAGPWRAGERREDEGAAGARRSHHEQKETD